jgi:hypothetical protein
MARGRELVRSGRLPRLGDPRRDMDRHGRQEDGNQTDDIQQATWFASRKR